MWCGVCGAFVEKSCVCVMCVRVVYICMWCGVHMVCYMCRCVWYDGNIRRGTCVCVMVHACIKIPTLIATKPSQNSSSQGV